jgi:3-phenylpropionate/trans-cinnamate dioxygenase ferredoxin reductase subunit
MVGREPDPPYHRPPVTKDYLRGEECREDALYRPDEWWAEQRVELLTRTSVMKLDPGECVATLSNREQVRFETALIATGANVRRLRVEGSELDGIHYLRTLANADSLRADAQAAERVVLVGGSYIGCEVAASLTAAMGVSCSILMLEDEPLERQFGPEVGRFFRAVLEDHGVRVHGGQELARLEGDGERVQRAVTGSGLELECDCVVIGAGVAPDVTLARSAGLELGESGGLRCSAGLETSLPGVFAAGDNCEYQSVIHGRPLRVEHWDVAHSQGRTAALNMLGRGVEHRVVPYFFSDLADWVSLEYVGPGEGEAATRGSLEDGEFSVFYVDGGRVTAALSVGRPDDLEHARRLITGGRPADPALLADPGTDLAAL